MLNLLPDIKGESILNSEETTLYFVSGPNCPPKVWIDYLRSPAGVPEMDKVAC